MARAFDITQMSRSVPGSGDGMRADPQYEAPPLVAICLFVALSWLLVGLVVAAISWALS
jgi:hypothetical protein